MTTITAAEHTCIRCQRTGLMKITIAGTPDREVAITCVYCDGIGTVEQSEERQRAARDAAEAMWCRCGAKHGSHYVDDTQASKHHWRCDDCGKITQIG